MQQPGMSTYTPNVVTTEIIQQYLDENKQLILTILEKQSLGRHNECAPFQAKLQQNLLFLAAIADSQPPLLPMPPQFPPPPATLPGSSLMQQQQQALQQIPPELLMPPPPPIPPLMYSPQPFPPVFQPQESLQQQNQLLMSSPRIDPGLQMLQTTGAAPAAGGSGSYLATAGGSGSYPATAGLPDFGLIAGSSSVPAGASRPSESELASMSVLRSNAGSEMRNPGKRAIGDLGYDEGQCSQRDGSEFFCFNGSEEEGI